MCWCLRLFWCLVRIFQYVLNALRRQAQGQRPIKDRNHPLIEGVQSGKSFNKRSKLSGASATPTRSVKSTDA